MCGRYTLSHQTDVARQFKLFEPARAADLPPRYNIAPTQPVPVVFREDGHRQLLIMRWGLIPFWMKPDEGNRVPAGWINARAETAATKPAFRAAFKYRRCLLPADGFYEWKRLDDKRKQPYLIRQADGGLFAFAGLYEWWTSPDGSELPTCTILTTRANRTLATLHHRMPVILQPEDYDRWLDSPDRPPDEVAELLAPAPDGILEPIAVSRHVNNPRHDDPKCLEPANTG